MAINPHPQYSRLYAKSNWNVCGFVLQPTRNLLQEVCTCSKIYPATLNVAITNKRLLRKGDEADKNLQTVWKGLQIPFGPEFDTCRSGLLLPKHFHIVSVIDSRLHTHQ